jgi:signal transduction histidine kinase
LSSKLLLLTVLFVMLAEVLIFVPSLAFFRLNWLIDRLNLAQVAALVAEAAPDGDLPELLRKELLSSTKVRMVALKRSNQRRLILSEPIETPVSMTFDLRGDGRTTSIRRSPGHIYSLIRDALVVFVADEKSHIRVIGEPGMGAGELIEIVIPLRPLKQAMLHHALNVLVLSVMISLLTAVAVYMALNRLLVVPMQRLTEAMVNFSTRPEDASRIVVPSKRNDEIGLAEAELAHMQSELHSMLAQKSRLAALGLAVSKINHDLRNLLANAQLLSDRLTSLPDPQVQRFAPKLIASLDRAIKFCNESLQFGRAAEPAPRRERVNVSALLKEVGEGLGLPRTDIDYRVEVAENLHIDADRDQLYRVMSNLVRNSLEAMSSPGNQPSVSHTIAIKANRTSPGGVEIHLRDDGPGVPARARASLFQPFQGSTRRGGTGLGLAIASEIVAAHGGEVTLVDDSADNAIHHTGAHFRIFIPDRTNEPTKAKD